MPMLDVSAGNTTKAPVVDYVWELELDWTDILPAVVTIYTTSLNAQKLHSFPIACVYKFRVILSIDYFRKFPWGL